MTYAPPVIARRTSRRLGIFCSMLAIAVVPLAKAQGYLTAIGNYNFSQHVPVELGYYDPSTGDMHLVIPLGSWPQRGGSALGAALVYDSRIWFINNNTWQPTNIPNSSGGWRFQTVPVHSGGSPTHSTTIANCPGGSPGQRYTYYNNFAWSDSTGEVHAFPILTQNDPLGCNGGSGSSDTEYAGDASGYVMSVTNYTTVSSIYDATGALVYPNSTASIKDRNGNYFAWNGSGNPTDTTGRTYVITTTNCNGHANQTCYDVSNSQNTGTAGTSRFIATTESLSVQTLFQQSGVTEYSGTVTVLQSIQLPDNTTYQFTYDNGGQGTYGELTGMTLPPGGSITYSYGTYFDMFGNHNRWLQSKTFGSAVWQYSAGNTTQCASGYAYCQTVTVFKPDGKAIGYTFGSNLGSAGSWLTNTTYYNANGSTQNPIVSTSTTWTSTSALGAMPATETTQMLDASSPYPTTTVHYSYTGTNIPLVSTISEWNYYTGSLPSTPSRITSFTYGYFGKAFSYQQPTTVIVTDGAGTQTYRKTNITYDGGSLNSRTGIVNHDDANYGVSFTSRGNPTSIAKLVSGSNYLTTSTSYDMTGQPVSATDASGHTSLMSYADNYYSDGSSTLPSAYSPPTPTNAYLTSVTLPLSGTFAYGYYYGTGQQALLQDQNSAKTYLHYYDSLNRATEVISPISGWTLWQYQSGSETQVDTYAGISDTSPSATCVSCRHDRLNSDGLGRAISSVLMSDPDGSTTSTMSFDGNSRLMTSSNPYRSTSDPTYGSDTTAYDGFDRVVSTTHADTTSVKTFLGAAVGSNGGQSSQLCAQSTYGVGYPVLTIDEASRKRQFWNDAFGRTIETDESNSSGALTVNTCYGYDPADDLTSVAPLGATARTYLYDLIGRITQAIDPESGTVNYYYTNSSGGVCSGNAASVCRRTDARGITATYSYDAESRLGSMSYSDGTTPTINYYYDQVSYNGLTILNGKGRRTGMSDGSGQSAWSFDAAGDVISQRQTISGITNTVNYSYNPDGSPASITYPSGRTITYAYGNAGRATSAIDTVNGINYATQATYSPIGAPASVLHGHSNTFGGITESNAYNSRIEITGTAATSSNGTAFSLTEGYVQPTGNNLTLASETNNLDNGRNLSTSYDFLNRVSSAQTQATSGADCWGLTFGDDALGNLLSETVSKCSAYALSVSVNNKNQITGYSYDASGDLTGDGLYGYSYNAMGQLTSAAGVNYSYDGSGARVSKSSGTLFWRSASGRTLTETDLAGNLKNEYVYFGGHQIALRNSSGSIYYYFLDHLGSTRVITDSLGNQCYDTDFYPYGVEVGPFKNSCPQNFKFTGYERDAETGLDYAFGRYYNSRIGRFMSSDPDSGSSNAGDPQSWNRYTYVENNPLTFTDPDGLSCTEYSLGVDDHKGKFDKIIPAEASIYPYDKMGKLGGILSAGFGKGGDDAALTTLLSQPEPGGYDLVVYSGSAQTLKTVLKKHPELSKNIASVTYLSPGINISGAGGMYLGNNGVAFKASGLLDWFATMGARSAGVQLLATKPEPGMKTTHDFASEMTDPAVRQRLATFPGSKGPCPSRHPSGEGSDGGSLPVTGVWYGNQPEYDDEEGGAFVGNSDWYVVWFYNYPAPRAVL
ncbi:RHS repeat-associated core domain-containing protein [Telmatobacter sp. DSM 110680]|uniref:RHS repeat-associated core domain-containing protein n=1 Tax=Telmatobacter sp. DSM 110680 TaxID=3036704 RepID=A0AAU7DDN9_9BACT